MSLATFAGYGMALPPANACKTSCKETTLEIILIITKMEIGVQLREINEKNPVRIVNYRWEQINIDFIFAWHSDLFTVWSLT